MRGIVVSTTDKVYLNDNLGLPFDESKCLAGSEPYSASKVGQEAVIDSWLSLSRNQNYEITSVRAGNVIGGGDISDNRLMPDLFRAIEAKASLKIRNPNHTRPWQHVLDPLVGYLKVCAYQFQNKNERAFNFGPSEESLSVDQVLTHSKELIGDRFPKIELVASHPQAESEKLSLASGKAIKLLDWKPVWDQKSSIESTINWWMNTESLMSPKEACEVDISKLFTSGNESNQ